MRALLVSEYLRSHLRDDPRYEDPKKLNRFEYQVFSQNGEDGALEEVFRRIGTTNEYFVELGAGDGLENNTTCLLLRGWSGCWLEREPELARRIEQKFAGVVRNGRLSVRRAAVTAENVESLLVDSGVPKEPDLLSIDIDGMDYWVWRAISSFQPRVVVIEYNALYRPPLRWVAKYDPAFRWDGRSCYWGASLESLTRLGVAKGCKLVGCDFTGNNAFFVREDLVGDRFAGPFAAETHYEPQRHYLVTTRGYYDRDFGDFESL